MIAEMTTAMTIVARRPIARIPLESSCPDNRIASEIMTRSSNEMITFPIRYFVCFSIGMRLWFVKVFLYLVNREFNRGNDFRFFAGVEENDVPFW
jgi:hypothetical protein